MGPSTEITDQPSGRQSLATSPGDGRRPTTPHSAAGMRSEPPVSEPVASGSMSTASAAADPPEEPPAFSPGLKGLPVAPQTGLRVLAPAPMSGTLVLAVTMAPAAGRTQPGHEGVVGHRHVVAQGHVATGGEQARGVLQVLHALRQAVQQAQRLAAHHLGFGMARALAGPFKVGGGNRIDGRFQGVDAGDARLHQLDRGHLAAADQPAQFNGRKLRQYGGGWAHGVHSGEMWALCT